MVFRKTGIKNQKYYRRKIFFLVVLLVCLFSSFRYIWTQVLELSERQCISRLMENTDHFCTILNENIDVAQNHLVSLSETVGDTIGDREKMQETLQTFEPYGALCRLEILYPDNTLLVSGMEGSISTELDFDKEYFKGNIISSRMKDPLDQEKNIFKIAVPVENGTGDAVVLYGIMDIAMLTGALDLSFYEKRADYFVVEQFSGELLLDTRYEDFSEDRRFRISKTDSQYESFLKILEDIRIGKESYARLYSPETKEYIYLGYGNVGIKDWGGMISVPEDVAFSYANETIRTLRGAMVLMFLGVFLYLALSLRQESEEIKKNQFVVQIQSLLMQAQRAEEAFENALLTVKDRFSGKLIFLTNLSESTERLVIIGNLWTSEELQEHAGEFIQEMTAYAKDSRKGEVLMPGSILAKKCPFTTGFLLKHYMDNMIFLPIYSPDGEVSDIMGIMDAKSYSYAVEMLEELSCNFVLTMHDLKYLQKMEKASMTDALTGTMNRASYHERKAAIEKKQPNVLGCIYIDVDNLHVINNFYGHDLGDAMLKFISGAVAEQFGIRNLYRIGGDEFVVLIDHITEEELSQRMEAANRRIIENDYHVSYGVEWSASPLELEKMIKSAEEKMYEAKKQYHMNS